MTEGGKRIREAVGDRPASPFAPLRPFLRLNEEDAATGMSNLAAALRDFDPAVRLHIRLLDGSTTDHWDIEGGTRKAAAHRRAPKSADVVVILRRETWLRIARGSLSPFDALFSGRMRVGGDTTLGKRVAQHLSDPAVPFVPPC
jgi:hypothetical protein